MPDRMSQNISKQATASLVLHPVKEGTGPMVKAKGMPDRMSASIHEQVRAPLLHPVDKQGTGNKLMTTTTNDSVKNRRVGRTLELRVATGKTPKAEQDTGSKDKTGLKTARIL